MTSNLKQAVLSAAAALAVVVSGASIAAASGIAEPETFEPDKSIAFYIGGDLTEDGYPMLGGFGHEPSSHWVEVVPEQQHPEGSTIIVGATDEARLPGELIEIPQAAETYRYITSNYSEFARFPAPLTNGGLNEHNVAGRDVWSNSREELVDMTPDGQTGPQYSDLSRIAMERATTAEEAVTVLGELIDGYGYTTYGGNSHLFADENEGWVFLNFAGGQGLWAAERLGPDEIRVSYPAIFMSSHRKLSMANIKIFVDRPTLWNSQNRKDGMTRLKMRCSICKTSTGIRSQLRNLNQIRPLTRRTKRRIGIRCPSKQRLPHYKILSRLKT